MAVLSSLGDIVVGRQDAKADNYFTTFTRAANAGTGKLEMEEEGEDRGPKILIPPSCRNGRGVAVVWQEMPHFLLVF